MRIKTISFLFKEKRVFLECNMFGKFMIPVVEKKRGKRRTVEKPFSARQVIDHHKVKISDPSLTLNNGEKVRVFQGGDPAFMLTYPASVIDSHDESYARDVLEEEDSSWYDHASFPF